jgi:hypothetical protein
MSQLSRRQMMLGAAAGLSHTALTTMLAGPAQASDAPAGPHFAPRAKRVIWLFMAGAPSQLDLFDHKPALADRYDEDLPDSVRNGQRLTGMSSGQARFPVAPSIYKFAQHGQAGTWISELLPWTARIVDDIAVIKTLQTDAINHEPATIYINSGSQVGGKPSLGSWLSYGLGRPNENLPSFAVMTSRYTQKNNVQALSSRMWSSGFLPAEHGGVAVRGGKDPLLYLSNPPGVDAGIRRSMLDGVRAMNLIQLRGLGDPQIADRITQYEMAFRMQSAVPELADLSGETAATRALYGDDVDVAGSFAANCLTGRRLLERGVRFVQIYHRGWDSHQYLPLRHPAQCRDVDRACYGLITDLKSRGLLQDTLVIWGGEFGRTVYSQGPLTPTNYGRDHHPRCFSIWMAGAGIKPGLVFGETDDYSYNVVRDPVHLRDLHATILHLCGLDHHRLSVRHQGLDQRLIAVGNPARVVTELLA